HRGNGGWRPSAIVARPRRAVVRWDHPRNKGQADRVAKLQGSLLRPAVYHSRGEPTRAAWLWCSQSAMLLAQLSAVDMPSGRSTGEPNPKGQPQKQQPHADVL